MSRIPTTLLMLSGLASCLSGCVVSSQSFGDKSFNEDGTVLRVVTLVTRTWAPPFGSKAKTEKLVMISETADGWELQIGSEDVLEGGDASKITASVVQGVVGALTPLPP